MENKLKVTDEAAIEYHRNPVPGKFDILPTKPMNNQYDLSLAYSPGVAVPCLEIQKNPELAYDYTNKGNLVGVITNGTAVLGLGNIGALASKPVMEGKSVLFKKFANVNSIDIEVNETDPDMFIEVVKSLEPTFGGINLEDIKGPDCFYIEQTLKAQMNIPVFHDDQHGTAIIALAGLINACEIRKIEFKELQIVMNGAGAAGIAICELIKRYGLPHNNLMICDTKGVIYEGRPEGMTKEKTRHAVPTEKRTLLEACTDANVFIGVSCKGALKPEMLKSMAPNPIIFALANPNPEITPEDAAEVRNDAIVATGRSDYPNQINNVMCFPFLFRGTLDVRASSINEDMKMAASKAIAGLAKLEIPQEVKEAYQGIELTFGPGYILPTPFDPRLKHVVSMAVAKAACDSGIAKKPITDWEAYKRSLIN